MGMVVRQLPGGEIQPAMKTGLIDAAEFNNPTSDSQFGMQDVSKHYHLGIYFISDVVPFVVPLKTKNPINIEFTGFLSGTSRNRTRDTRIFSPLLYQLS